MQQAYTDEVTIGQNGVLTLKNLPFKKGESVEVIIIARTKTQPTDAERYPFWGKPITYPNPTDPVAETDWDVLK